MSEQDQPSQDEVNALLDDVQYVGNEADALRYVIDEVPYTEAPAGGRSIGAMLLMLDHAQINYYRPIIEEAFKSAQPIQINSYTPFRESFDQEVEEDFDIFKALKKIAKHRAGLVNLLDQIPLIDWERSLLKGERELSLYSFVQEMVREDRKLLKEIAELVMNYSQQIRAQKEIEMKSKQRAKGASQ
jgi:hypothetical protein